jgi:glycosyltransferase involved in cell wall biosynthesis
MTFPSERAIAVVVPAFNEAYLIERTLRGIPAFVSLIVVVDDASWDATAERALAVGDPRVVLVQHSVNAGVGAAISTGYRVAFERGADVCAVMAGDGQMDPTDLPALLAPVLSGEVAYAKGCRLSYPGARERMPWTRWLGNWGLGLLTRLATGLSVRDSQCGYTALARHAADVLPIERMWPGYGYPNDLLGMLADMSLPIREVTVRPVYADERSGVGLRHAFFVVPYVLARVWLRRIVGRLATFSETLPETPHEPSVER